MTTITKADIKKSTTAELLAFYNANSNRGPITRFADRATAEKRVRQLIDLMAGADSPGSDAPATDQEAPKPSKTAKAKTAKPKAEKPVAEVDPEAQHAKRSASISKSWKDSATAQARSARNGCKVSGEVYPSVMAAFRALKLDVKKHQRVRRDMVVNGHTNFSGHRFTLVRDM